MSAWIVSAAPLTAALLDPLREAAAALQACSPRQALLSGIHNPFGRGAALIGPDVVLWDSELYLEPEGWRTALRHEGRYWPADPLAGALVDIALASGTPRCCDVRAASDLPVVEEGAHYVVRYMPASSHFNRDPLHAPNRVAMEERPLVNYPERPLWLVRGEDRAGNDYAAGFLTQAPGWAADSLLQRTEV